MMHRRPCAILIMLMMMLSSLGSMEIEFNAKALGPSSDIVYSGNVTSTTPTVYVVEGTEVMLEQTSVLSPYTGGSNQYQLILSSGFTESGTDLVAYGTSLYFRAKLPGVNTGNMPVVVQYDIINDTLSSLSGNHGIMNGPVLHEGAIIWEGFSTSGTSRSLFSHNVEEGVTTEHSYSYQLCNERPVQGGFFVCWDWTGAFGGVGETDILLLDVDTFTLQDTFTYNTSTINASDFGLEMSPTSVSAMGFDPFFHGESLFLNTEFVNPNADPPSVQRLVEFNFSTNEMMPANIHSTCVESFTSKVYYSGNSTYLQYGTTSGCGVGQYRFEATNHSWVQFSKNGSRIHESDGVAYFVEINQSSPYLASRNTNSNNSTTLSYVPDTYYYSTGWNYDLTNNCYTWMAPDGCRGPIKVGDTLYFIMHKNSTMAGHTSMEPWMLGYDLTDSTLSNLSSLAPRNVGISNKPLLSHLGNLWYFNETSTTNQHLSRFSPTNISSWVMTGGDLPDGVQLNKHNGTVHGLPTTPGNYSFTVTQVNGPTMQNTTLHLTVLPDHDGDGLPNNLPQNYTGLLIEDLDDDNDGWNDLEEARCQSDPLDSANMPFDFDQNNLCDISIETEHWDVLVGSTLLIPVEVTLNSHNVSRNPSAQLTSSFSPSLPLGLTFNLSISALQGVPLIDQPTTDYELTIANTTSSLSINFSLRITYELPNVSYQYSDGDEFLLEVGTPFSHSFSNSGGEATSWSGQANLPTGLNFSLVNLTLFGATQTAFPRTIVVLSFSNPTGEQMIEMTLRSVYGDDDSDGVNDDEDLCSNTATGSVVDKNGCADNQKDTDNDGVTDDLDSCPETHDQFDEVDQSGCSPSQQDDDQDGIENGIDGCPNTPVGSAPDSHGCSDAQRDTDGDGITDDIDRCPNTNVTDSVDSRGCGAHQLDSDGDGIVDAVDECPSSPPGTQVNSVGCANVSDPGGNGGGSGSPYVDDCPSSAAPDMDCDFSTDEADQDKDADMIQDIIEVTDGVGTVGVTDLTYLHELQWERTSTGVKFTLDYRVHDITGYSYQIGVVNMIYPNGTARPSEDLLRVFSEEDKAYLEQRLCEQPDGISDFSPVDWLSSSVRYQGATITPDSTSCTWENQPRKVSAGFLPRSTLDPSNIAKYDTRLTYEFEFSLPQTVATLVILPIDDTSWDYEHPRDRAYSIQTSEDTSKALFTWFQHATISLPAFSSSEDGSSQDETSSVSVPPGSITYNVKTTLNTGKVDCQVFTDSDVRQLTVYPGSSSRIYSSEDIDIVCLGLGENWDSPDMDFCIELMYSSRTLRQGCDVGSSVQVTLAYDNFGESSDDTYDWEQDLSDWEQELQNDLNNLFDYEDPNQDGDATGSSGSSAGGDGLGFLFCTLPTIGGVVLLVVVLSRHNNTARRAQTQRPTVNPHTPAVIVPFSVPVPHGLETVSPVQHTPEIVASDPIPVPPGLGQATNVHHESEETNPEPNTDTGETVVETSMLRGNSPLKAPDFIHNINEPEIGRFAEHYDDEGYEWVTFDEKSWYRPAGERIPWELWAQDQ